MNAMAACDQSAPKRGANISASKDQSLHHHFPIAIILPIATFMTYDMNRASKKCLSFCVLATFALSMVPMAAKADIDPRDSARLLACITKIDSAPLEAYEDGLVWRSQSGGVYAEQCLALAKIANGDVAGGAARLSALASTPEAGDEDQRALLLAKAANAWLMIDGFDPALRALNAALLLKPAEVDLLIDRARAFAGLGQWSKAQDDLTLALSKRPSDSLIFRLRAETHLQQAHYDAAQQDVNQALVLSPRDIETYVMRGRVIEARRLGRVPD
jgi:tetratricopeptide (TPR) repeat protein